MPQSILLLQDSVRTSSDPARKLVAFGYNVHILAITVVAGGRLRTADADLMLLEVNLSELPVWCKQIYPQSPMPLVWWCESKGFSAESVIPDTEIDGIVCPGMSPFEIHCAFQLSVIHYRRRQQWVLEREQLLSRLEERKWVEQAKGILSEIKNISEAEAYSFLRNQAMSERKKLIDVATSIVKVYQILREEKKHKSR